MAGVGSFDLFAQPATSNVVNLIGSGIGRTNFVRKLTTGYSTISLSAPNITISDFTIDGNYPTNTSAVGTSVNEFDIIGNNVQCKNIEVKNFAGQAGIFNTGQYVNISNCQITGVNSSGKSSWGILTYPLPIDPITTIRDCNISYCDLNAICVNGYTTIETCNFENNCRPNGGHIWGGGGVDGAIATRVMNCDFKGSLGGASGIRG